MRVRCWIEDAAIQVQYFRAFSHLISINLIISEFEFCLLRAIMLCTYDSKQIIWFIRNDFDSFSSFIKSSGNTEAIS